MTPRGRRVAWVLWAAAALGLAAFLTSRLGGNDRRVFVPGPMTSAHHQIELACNACHTEPFTSATAMQGACEGCHAQALDTARDSHPQSKFTDPRNADRTAKLDARYCVTCHVEHRPELADAMAVTVPADYCALCHADVGVERPTHAGLGFETCASSGCHNFHDNRALYEDFLLRHLDAPALLSNRGIEARNFASVAPLMSGYPLARFPLRPLTAFDMDLAATPAPPDDAATAAATGEWAASAHAANGVACGACHTPEAGGAWVERPGREACAGCHAGEMQGFLGGKHGMRLDATKVGVELSPMRPGLARLPMKPDAADRELGCGSCHSVHRVDTRAAAVDACLGCHDDQHSKAYRDSPHGRSFAAAAAGELPAEQAVSCATCHMPRTPRSYDFGAYVHVQVEHNQSDTLRPNDKMLRPVCLECHGLGFALDALADPGSIRGNFNGPPQVHVQSLELAGERRRAIEHERQQAELDRQRREAAAADGAAQGEAAAGAPD